MDTDWASATEIAAAVSAGRVSATAVVEDALARITERDPVLNSFTDVVADRARARAAAIDASKQKGPLAGVPFAVKNLFDIEGLATRAGSKINRELPAGRARRDADQRLEAAGAVLVGGLNMGEYAYDFTGENVHDGPSRNPHDPTRMTGGSSGGSGGAVAGGLVPLALGSDTNGSIRVPASFCGLFGLKPTYGRLPRARTLPVRRQPRSSGPVRPLGARPGAGLRRDAGARRRRSGLRRPAGRADAAALEQGTRAAHRHGRRLFPRRRIARRWPRGTVAEGARRDAGDRDSRGRRGPCRGLSSSPDAKARRCISTGCARAPTISIPRCATGCSPAPWCRRRGSTGRRSSAAGFASKCCELFERSM